MMSPTTGLGLRNSRVLIAAFGQFRMFRSPARQVTMLAGVRTRLAQNDTPFPLAVVVQAAAFAPVVFSPNSDAVPGATAIFRPIPVNVGPGMASFNVPPYQELWATTTLPDVFRVMETRV